MIASFCYSCNETMLLPDLFHPGTQRSTPPLLRDYILLRHVLTNPKGQTTHPAAKTVSLHVGLFFLPVSYLALDLFLSKRNVGESAGSLASAAFFQPTYIYVYTIKM